MLVLITGITRAITLGQSNGGHVYNSIREDKPGWEVPTKLDTGWGPQSSDSVER